MRLVRHETALDLRRREAGERGIPRIGPGGMAVLLDDVRSTWNLGSLLRTCDGLGVRHLFVCGISPLPTQREVCKTALGAEQGVSWSYHAHPFEALDLVQAEGGAVIAVEEAPGAVRLADFAPPACLFVLVFGNEPDGVSPEVLARADQAVWIPMRGVKQSLNVSVAAGIVLHHCAEHPSRAAR